MDKRDGTWLEELSFLIEVLNPGKGEELRELEFSKERLGAVLGKVRWDGPGGDGNKSDAPNRLSLDLIAKEASPLLAQGLELLVRLAPSVLGDESGPDKFRDCFAVGDGLTYQSSGVLYAGQWVMTAGHVHALGIKHSVFTGHEVEKAGSGEELKVECSVRHECFIGQPYFRDDIALLELNEEPKGVCRVEIACGEELDRASFGLVVGYGANDPKTYKGYGKRRMAVVPILRPPGPIGDECSFSMYDPDKEFVAAAPLSGADACMGDSGGGFYICGDDGNGNKVLRLAGLVSRQVGSCAKICGAGSIYLRLHAYEEWIEEKTSMAGSGPAQGHRA